MIAAASILMIRVLVKEQECITAHSQAHTTYTRTPWLTHTRDLEKPRNINTITNNHNIVHNNNSSNNNIQHLLSQAPQTVYPIARRTKTRRGNDGGAGAAGSCRNCRQSTTRIHVRRRGAGMTDIERVTVNEQSRSVDSNQLGIRSFIAEWTRGVEGAVSTDHHDGEIQGAVDLAGSRQSSASPAQKELESITMGEGDLVESSTWDEEEEEEEKGDVKSHLSSPVGMTAVSALPRLTSTTPVRFSRPRSSSFQIGSPSTQDRADWTNTIF
jgi:hypothetical protein